MASFRIVYNTSKLVWNEKFVFSCATSRTPCDLPVLDLLLVVPRLESVRIAPNCPGAGLSSLCALPR